MMFDLKKLKISAAAIGVGAAMIASTTMADTVIRVQSVLANSSDEVRMVESFAADVAELTGGSLTIEILPAGAVVGPATSSMPLMRALLKVALLGLTIGAASTQQQTYSVLRLPVRVSV